MPWPPSRHFKPRSALLAALALVLACGKAERGNAEPEPEPGMGGGGEPQEPGSSALGEVLQLDGVLARQPGACAIRLGDGATVLGQGVLDRSLASAYTSPLMVRSDFGERVLLTGAEINLTSSTGQPLFPPYRPTTTGFIDPNSTGIALVALLPAPIVSQLRPGKVVATVSVNGQTSGGRTMTSSPMTFAIEVCDGCLVSYPEAARNPQSPDGSYLCKTGTAAADSLGSTTLPCELGIDLPVPCSACSDAFSVCQSPANNPSL